MNAKICPYPGLRTFTEEESIYFKGREENIKSAIKLVQQNKFLMLTGSSGDGKSSMVFAGIIPQARAGIFSGEFPNWLVLDFKPARNPIGNLAQVLQEKLLNYFPPQSIEQKLNLGFSALSDLYKNSSAYYDKNDASFLNLSDEEKKQIRKKAKNVLIVVDQFEELYTNPENFTNGVPSLQSKLLINLIIEANKIAVAENIPLYIICTMRSDYFGLCTSFSGLPELIGKSQYFIPRLTRKDIHRIIEDPAILSGNNITPRLIERLLYEIKEGTDILPVIQHALFRIWKEYNEDNAPAMDLIHYAKVGGLAVNELPKEDQLKFENWLNQQPDYKKSEFKNPGLSNVLNAHANELYESIEATKPENARLSKKIIRHAFVGMTRIDEGKAVRNRISIGELHNLINDPEITCERINKCVEVFALKENSLIRTFYEKNLQDNLIENKVLDITHEALIRNWELLGLWLKDETENTIIFNDLISQLNKWLKENKAKGFLLSEGQFAFYSTWYKETLPSAEWMFRFNQKENNVANNSNQLKQFVEEYLHDSSKAVNFKKKLLRSSLIIISMFLLFALYGFYNSNIQEKKANASANTSYSNELAMRSFLTVEENPTVAFRIAEAAYKSDSTSLSREALMNAYMKGPFYEREIKGHSSIVNWTEYSNNGKFIVSCSDDQSAIIYDDMGNVLHRLIGHNTRVISAHFSQDDKYLVTQGTDSIAFVWSMDGKLIKKIIHHGVIRYVKFINEQNRIISASDDGYAKIWDTNGNELFSTPKLNFQILNVSNSNDLTNVFLAGTNRLVKWNAKTKQTETLSTKSTPFNKVKNLNKNNYVTYGNGNELALWSDNKLVKSVKLPCGDILYVKLSPDKKYLVARTDGNNGLIINMADLSVIELKAHSARINYININNQGDKIVTCSDDNAINMWDLNGNLIYTLKPNDITYAANFSKDDKKLITSHNLFRSLVWNLENEKYKVLSGHKDVIWNIAFSPSGKYIASASWDNTVKIWDAINGRCIKTFHFPAQMSYAIFSQDEKELIVSGFNGELDIINLNDFSIKKLEGLRDKIYKIQTIPNSKNFVIPSIEGLFYWNDVNKELVSLKGHTSKVTSVSVSKEGWFVSGSFDNSSILWDKNGKMLSKNKEAGCLFYRSAISKDDKYFAMASNDGTVILYNKKGQKLKSIKAGASVGAITFHNTNSDLLCFGCKNGLLVFWDLKRDKFSNYQSHSGMINTLTFYKNENRVLTASDDGTAKLIDDQGNEITVYKGHKKAVQFSCFSPDYNSVYTSGHDGLIMRWPLTIKNVMDWIEVKDKENTLYKLSETEKAYYNISN